MADISSELATIHDDPLGRHVKQAIYDALMKVNYDVEHYEPKGAEWPIDHMIVGLFNGYLLPTSVGKMGENPNTEFASIVGTSLMVVRDCWCITEQRIASDVEDPSLESGSISDSGSHAWTSVANYRLYSIDTHGNYSYLYCHLFITRLLAGEAVTLSGDRSYDRWESMIIQNGAQQGDFDYIDTELVEELPYDAPLSTDYDTRVYVVSQYFARLGAMDTCTVCPSEDSPSLTKFPEPDPLTAPRLFLFIQTEDLEDAPTFIKNPPDWMTFYPGGTAITTFALR